MPVADSISRFRPCRTVWANWPFACPSVAGLRRKPYDFRHRHCFSHAASPNLPVDSRPFGDAGEAFLFLAAGVDMPPPAIHRDQRVPGQHDPLFSGLREARSTRPGAVFRRQEPDRVFTASRAVLHRRQLASRAPSRPLISHQDSALPGKIPSRQLLHDMISSSVSSSHANDIKGSSG